MARENDTSPVAVFKLQARTYAPWNLIGNPVADLVDADVKMLEVKVPRDWETGIPRGDLASIREWMEANELVLVDVQHRPNRHVGAWKGLYICKVGRRDEWNLNPYEMALAGQPEPEYALEI